MRDFSEFIQRHLLTLGLPVYNELKIESTTETPCITWLLDNDYDHITGDNLGFCWIQFSIKIWCEDKMITSEYIPQIDNLMKKLGFSRISTVELSVGSMTQTQIRYRGMYRENY